MQVNGLAALVTGAASGLGAATARALAKAGARVTLLDMNLEAARAVAGEIGGLAVQCDVSDAASAEAAVAAAREKHGPARIAVSCAGVAPAARVVGKAGPMALADFERVIRINLIGTFNMMRLAAAEMVGQDPLNEDGERGLIVNTASIAAWEGQIGQTAYAASKGGVASLTLPAARELARSGVRVVGIAPGTFETPMMAGMPQEVKDGLAAKVPYPSRLGRPEEFASLVLHIAANSYLNGSVLRLDGALRMEPR